MATEPVLSNQTCCFCQERPAYFHCSCTTPSTLLCSSCLPVHSAKSQLIPHLILSTAAFGLDYRQFEAKVKEIRANKKELERNLRSMDQYCAEITESIDFAIDYFQQYRDFVVRSIRAKQQEIAELIETAAEEAEACLAQGTQPATPLAQTMSAPPRPLRVFHYQIQPPDLPSLLHTWTSYTCDLGSLAHASTGAEETEQLVYVQETQIQRFSMQNRVWVRSALQSAVAVNKGSRYVWTDTSLFCSGGTA